MRFLYPKIKLMTPFLEFFLAKWVSGICIAPFGIYLKVQLITNAEVINHESIHWKQQVEMLIIFFYIWYLVEWLIKLIKYGREAYLEISFEREAHKNDADPNYLKTRKHYTWIKNL